MSKTPNQTLGFYAVRRGKLSLTNCIFLNWEDCRSFLEGDEKAEYSVYDNVHHAIQYLTAPYCQKNLHQNRTITSLSPLFSPKLSPPLLQHQQEHTRKMMSKSGTSENHKVSILSRKAGCNKSFQSTNESSKPLLNNLHPQQKQDMKEMDLLVEPLASTKHKDELETHSKEPKRRKLLESTYGPRKPTPQWENMFSKFKLFKEQNNDNTEIEDCGDPELIKWVKEQRYCYRNLKEDVKSGKVISQEKLDRLKEVGFDFQHYTWDDRINQLKEIQQCHDVIDDFDTFLSEIQPDLAKWCRTQKNHMKLFEKGKPSKLNADQAGQLKSLGLSGLLQKAQNYETEFQEIFPKLEQYKKDNGDCHVPFTYQKDQNLARFVNKQRLQYKRMKEGKTSHLTAERMIALTDLGFVFVPKGKQPTWDSRLQRLVEFKAEHGHLRFPETDQAMRAWVGRQRSEYRLFQAGRPSKMTQDKIDSLDKVGFVWDTGFKLGQIQLPRKTWDERFEELKEFIETNGHAVVPQATPGLGEWVHTQRTKYKRLQQGKKSSLKPEQALKLVEVGFVFDATNKRGKSSDEIEL